MGGHNAWRKRVKNGLLAKEGGGGAICRHHPRLGRRGKDLILNRKGHILGGSNKKKKIRERRTCKASVAEGVGAGIVRNISTGSTSATPSSATTKEVQILNVPTSIGIFSNMGRLSVGTIALIPIMVSASIICWYVIAQSKYGPV